MSTRARGVKLVHHSHAVPLLLQPMEVWGSRDVCFDTVVEAEVYALEDSSLSDALRLASFDALRAGLKVS